METLDFRRLDSTEKAQNRWKHLCSLAGVLALLLTSCATENAIQRSSHMEKKGDLAGAYTNIVAALQLNPDNEKLLAERKLIGQEYADDLLQQSYSLDTNDLPGKIRLLQSASQVDCTNQIEITAVASALQQERTAMLKRAESLESADLIALVAGTEDLQGFFPFDADLRKILIENPAVIANVEKQLNQLGTTGNFKEQRRLALRSEKLWDDDNLKTIEVKAVEKLHESGFQDLLLSKNSDPSLGNKMICYLIKGLLAGDQEFDDYNSARDELQKYFAPKAKIFIAGALSENQKTSLDAAIVSLPGEPAIWFIPQSQTNIPDFVIIVDVTDAAGKLGASSQLVYSKYHAGDTQEPNPEYNTLYIQYQQLLAQAQSAETYNAVNGGLVNAIIAVAAEKKAAKAGNLLAATPQYLSVPVYEDYQIKETDLVDDCRLQARIRLVDGLTGSNLYDAPLDEKGQFTFTEYSDVHPEDVKSFQNTTAPSDWDNSNLEKFINDHQNDIATNVANLYDLATLQLAANAIKNKNGQTGVELGLAWASRADRQGIIAALEAEDEMAKEQAKFDSMCFGDSEGSWNDLQKEIVQTVMSYFGGLIIQENPDAGAFISTADSMELEASQMQFIRPTKDISGTATSDTATAPSADVHAKSTISAALRATVTIITDQGSGSGFIISTNGYIVTNFHVIDGANQIEVQGADGNQISATVVDSNTSRDLAILKVNEENWNTIQLGDIDQVEIGEPVYAIGSPLRLDQTVTRGVVSAIRDFPSESNPNIQVEYIQTDALINEGNSGGPLIDEEGKVVGVNCMKIVGQHAEGLGFAVSANEIKKLFYRYINN